VTTEAFGANRFQELQKALKDLESLESGKEVKKRKC
jgi:hypothetical protein